MSREGGVLRADGPTTGRREGWWVSFVIRAPRRADLDLETVNGPLGVADVSGRMELDVVNGPLTLDVPEGYSAQLVTGTRNGPMNIGFPVTVQGRIGAGSRSHLETTLGSGGPQVRAVTTNGPAVIRRR